MTANMDDQCNIVKLSRKDGASARRQGILDAASALIFERGYDPVSIADIGAAAGVSGPAIYRHFDSKADILHVLCNQTVDRLIEFVGPRRPGPVEELGALVAGQVKLVSRYPQLVRVFSDEERSLPVALGRQVRQRERDHAQRWIDALRQVHTDMAPAGVETLAYAVVGLILSAARWPRALRSNPGFEARLTQAAYRLLDIPHSATELDG